MPTNADITASPITPITAGVNLQPLYLTAAKVPEFRAVGASYTTTLGPLAAIPTPYESTTSGTQVSINRGGMTNLLVIPVFQNGTSISPNGASLEMEVTRWYPVRNALAPAGADLTSLVYIPVSQRYDWTCGDISNSALSDAVIGSDGYLPDLLVADTEVGDPDSIKYSPDSDISAAILVLDVHGAAAVTLDVRDHPLSTSTDVTNAQILVGFE